MKHQKHRNGCGREDSNLHPQWGPGPKPGASAYSATPAAARQMRVNRECTAMCPWVPVLGN